MLEGAGTGERREVLYRVVAGLLQHEHVVAVRLVVSERDREPVRFRLGNGACTDGAGAAGDVLNHDLLAERARDVGGDDAGDYIGRPARRIGHDHLDRSGGLPGLGDGGSSERRGEQARGEQTSVDHDDVRFLGV